MDSGPFPRRGFRKTSLFALAVIPLVWAAMHYRGVAEARRVESISNFALKFQLPKGWVVMRHDPESLFLFRDPATTIDVRGAQNQVIADVNPTPELARDSLAQQFKDNTLAHMPGWTAEILDVVPCTGGDYRLVMRTSPDRSILTAIAVKGNTTILITLAAIGKNKPLIQRDVPAFRTFLGDTALNKVDSASF